jgi:predicted nucleotide-binding protein (sugar kinase/HSP70/actin superfamily)
VVVLGRPYPISHPGLNSNVPPLLREQGALAIPVDCYPLEVATPVFPDLYWGYAQRILRAAEQVRRTPGLYSVYCSNYSCGPDSFNLHFYAYLMEGKPFAVLETDGHAGDAGTKTRVEAFLYCVAQDRKHLERTRKQNDFARIRVGDAELRSLRREEETVLIPLLGPGPQTFAAALRGLGFRAECLPPLDADSLRLGRRYTSGKECLPMCMTLGALLHRIEKDPDPERRFVLGMPSSRGPCRFGVYNLLNRITLERRQLSHRVRIWSPVDDDYFSGLPPGFSMLAYAGFLASDVLLAGLLDTRPGERRAGDSGKIHQEFFPKLVDRVEAEARAGLTLGRSLWEVGSGRLFGIPALLRRAATALAQVDRRRDLPTVLLVGEIYVRCNDFANDSVIDKLEQRGLRVHLAPFTEWIDYVEEIARREGRGHQLSEAFRRFLQGRIGHLLHAAVAGPLGWPARVPVQEILEASREYVPWTLSGEAVLTLGGPLHEWRHQRIDAVVNAGPHECMPSKIAEAQFYHIAEREGLPSLTLPLNGDPIDPEILDNFAFEVHERRRSRRHPQQPQGRAIPQPR